MVCGTAKGRRVYGGTFLAVPCICTPRCRRAEAEVRARWRRRRVCATLEPPVLRSVDLDQLAHAIAAIPRLVNRLQPGAALAACQFEGPAFLGLSSESLWRCSRTSPAPPHSIFRHRALSPARAPLLPRLPQNQRTDALQFSQSMFADAAAVLSNAHQVGSDIRPRDHT
jgi:hypothetical protein